MSGTDTCPHGTLSFCERCREELDATYSALRPESSPRTPEVSEEMRRLADALKNASWNCGNRDMDCGADCKVKPSYDALLAYAARLESRLGEAERRGFTTISAQGFDDARRIGKLLANTHAEVYVAQDIESDSWQVMLGERTDA